MEFAIGIGIGVVIGLIADRRMKIKIAKKPSFSTNEHQKSDEELISVVLPTIDSNK